MPRHGRTIRYAMSANNKIIIIAYIYYIMDDTINIKFIGAEITVPVLLAEKSGLVRAWINFGRHDNYINAAVETSTRAAELVKKHLEGSNLVGQLDRAILFECIILADFLLIEDLVDVCARRIGASFIDDVFI